jgi:hypothetical protein
MSKITPVMAWGTTRLDLLPLTLACDLWASNIANGI